MTNMHTNQNDVQEYSLLDLILVIYKNRKLFIWTVVIITIFGGLFAVMNATSDKYVYRQPVQLASYYLDGKQNLLQTDTSVISDVNNLYIPRFIEQYRAQHSTFHEAEFINNFSVQSSFEQAQGQDNKVSSSVIYFEFKGKKMDLAMFQQASDSILQQIHVQEQPILDSLLTNSKANLSVLQNEIPKLETVGELLKSYSAHANNNPNGEQGLAVVINTRETYLNLMSQSQTLQNVIQYKQSVNDLSQKITSLTPTTAAPIIVLAAKPKMGFISMILLSFIIGLFIALLLVFIKATSASIREQLKLAK